MVWVVALGGKAPHIKRSGPGRALPLAEADCGCTSGKLPRAGNWAAASLGIKAISPTHLVPEAYHQMPRRLPAPWFVHELERAFVVADANSRVVAYAYFREEDNGVRQAKVLSYDEARRIAEDIAKLPELLARKSEG